MSICAVRDTAARPADMASTVVAAPTGSLRPSTSTRAPPRGASASMVRSARSESLRPGLCLGLAAPAQDEDTAITVRPHALA